MQPFNSSVLTKSYNKSAHQTVFSRRGSHDPYFAHQSKTTTLEMSTINQDQQQLQKKGTSLSRLVCVLPPGEESGPYGKDAGRTGGREGHHRAQEDNENVTSFKQLNAPTVLVNFFDL